MFLILTFAYLMGSIPFGKLITKFLTNKDITKTGSGNIGATNVYRSVSKKAGIAVLLLDGIKPICAFLIIIYLFPEHYLKYKYLIFLFSIIGHIFPIWLYFKGGKGVACFFGANLFASVGPNKTIIGILAKAIICITPLSIDTAEFNLEAKILAIVVFPTPLGPEKRYE